MTPTLTRRHLLLATAAAALPLRVARGADAKKLPRLLYANDTTNILSCDGPWHKPGQKLTEAMFLASVDEAADAGADAHLLQPGLGWNAWWPSKVEPIKGLVDWYTATYHAKPRLSAYQQYVLGGGDFIKLINDRCRQRGVMPFISFRLNDAHHKGAGVLDLDRPRLDGIGRYYLEHPEHRMGRLPGESSSVAATDDWTHEGPRLYKLSLIEELLRNYDLAGFELDFMRHPFYFDPRKTPADERRAIMLDFVTRVRKAMKPGQLLCVRIPSLLEQHEGMGIDPRKFADAGVDMFDLTSGFQTQQDTSLAEIKKMVGDRAVYLEMSNFTAVKSVSEVDQRRRTTPEQFTTTAHLAYERGATGIALFNFQYYRLTDRNGDPPAAEPPFGLIRTLKDPAACAALPQHYFIGVGFRANWRSHLPMPRDMKAGDTADYAIDMAPLTGGWKSAGKLRIQAAAPLGDSRWRASLNGQPLTAHADVSEPYPNPLTQQLGTAAEHRAWTVDPKLARDGINQVQITLEEGGPATLVALDLAIS